MSSTVTETIARTVSSKLVLAIILACQLMIILDGSIVITSLPEIGRTLHLSATDLSWVQNAYSLTFGGFLLLGARAGDLLGRRRVFIAGVAFFTLASLLAGFAHTSELLLIARAIQGLAAAFAAPSTLSLLMVSFPEGRERTRAISLYSAISGAGGSVGLVLGGILTDTISWRWGMFINVPIGLALILLAPRYLQETPRRNGRFDLLGAGTSTLGMTGLVYGFARAAAAGWSDAGTIASFAAGILLLSWFVRIEKRAEQPITPLRLFASRERSGAYLARLLFVGGMSAMFFFLTQYVQGVLNFSAIGAGIAFLPMTGVMFGMVYAVPGLLKRFGSSRVLIGGVLVAIVGMIWISRITVDTAYFPNIAIPLIILGIGAGVVFIPLTSSGIAGVAPNEAGAASGLVNVAHQMGASLGLGILITVFESASHMAAGGAAKNDQAFVLAHGAAAAITGSAIFLTLALAAILVLINRKNVPRANLRTKESIAGTIQKPAQ
ncbi:MFS transporter [Bacillus sp. 3255]|uniref:MFS transporter n=1 Tax=Bacillus sp. 3255 TaxID=2817904 RepID=UPI002863E30D|nr:MFS transporter [Bacillus sp. 3255]MDR6879869.1 EmrB/QacA subfamily drug resistance transporter [Bacillus sp. 3255]